MASNAPADVYNTPAGLPPPGVVPNLKNPYYRHTLYLTTGILCVAISTVAVTLRIFTKAHIMKQVRAEDYSLILAQLGFLSWTGLSFAAPGQGRHLWDVSIYNAMQLAKWENYLIILYGPLVFLSKFSVLVQLQHIFVTSRRQPVFHVIQALIWANLVFYLAYLFVDIFQCVPRERIWDKSVPGKCISLHIIFLAPGGINILSDCLILALPIFLASRLQMTLKNKLAVAMVFGTALFAIISGILRLVYSIWLTETKDVIWAVYPCAMWSAAELASITLAATLPTMPRLWKYIRTGERSVQHYRSTARRLPPFSSHKPRQPMNVENPTPSEDNVPLKGGYRELQDGRKGRNKDEMEMQILKTETYTVTSRTEQMPDVP